MADRKKLHAMLKEFLGNANVYFQPPPSVKIKYPCIIYNLGKMDQKYANDMTYLLKRRYEVTYITSDPDSELIDQFPVRFPLCSFDRHYTADNLNHYSYSIFY